jgi:predicted  nucleic acid-binding Zn-ribbon protein
MMTRLMCSERPEEVGAVKSELFKAGIRSEIRRNPLTEALHVTRLELWVESERDYFAAYKLYTKMQARSGNGQETGEGDPAAGGDHGADEKPVIDANVPNGVPIVSEARGKKGRPAGELNEASQQLEKEIEDLLEREDSLAETCTSLRDEVEHLKSSLAETQAAAQKKTGELHDQKTALERELAERKRAEEQLKEEVRSLQAKLKSTEETVLDKQKRLDNALQQLQTQQGKVVELRKEIVAREQEWDESKKIVAKARAELAVERQSRIAAEGQAAKSAEAVEKLEKQLAEQKELQEQLRVSVRNLNALRDRLLAKKSSVRV